jgi:hypothetical protein
LRFRKNVPIRLDVSLTMNDPSENELLSAYLDGELTADERAEVERLLAANPAAREALDELRAMSATLQALPRRELGEDLGRQVLREAQRRKLSQGEPEAAKANVGRPPSAVMDDLAQPGAAVPRSLMDSKSAFRRFVNRRTVVWLALTAAIVIMIKINEEKNRIPLANNGGREVARTPVVREPLVHGPLPPSSIGAAPGKSEALFRKAAGPAAGKSAAAAPPAAVAGVELRNKQSAADLSVRNAVAEKGQLGAEGPPPAEPGQFAGNAPARRAAKKQTDEGLLVVRCDISRQAARSEAFDRLLDANGVVWHVERGPADEVNDAKKEKAAPAREIRVRAQATPAQIKAVLAGLEAQPDVFLAVAVKPAQTDQSKLAQAPAAPGQPAQVPAEQAGAGPSRQASPLADGQRQLRLQGPQQQVAQSAPRQRVLFLVRVIDREQQDTSKKQP